MIQPINFLPLNIPNDSSAFYNSAQFIQNELKFLSTEVENDNEGFQRGQDQIKKAIDGEQL